MDAVFRALADPARRAIVEILVERNDQSLFELCVRFLDRFERSMSRQAVAKHVAVLRDAGLVELTTRGRTTIHHLDTTVLTSARAWLDHVAEPGRPS